MMSKTGTDVEEELEAEIQRQLDELSVDDGSDNEAEVAQLLEDEEVVPDEEDQLPSALDYVCRLQSRADQLQADLDECDEVMQYGSTAIAASSHDNEELGEFAREAGEDVWQLKQQVLAELEKEDQEEDFIDLDQGRDDLEAVVTARGEGTLSTDPTNWWTIGGSLLGMGIDAGTVPVQPSVCAGRTAINGHIDNRNGAPSPRLETLDIVSRSVTQTDGPVVIARHANDHDEESAAAKSTLISGLLEPDMGGCLAAKVASVNEPTTRHDLQDLNGHQQANQHLAVTEAAGDSAPNVNRQAKEEMENPPAVPNSTNTEPSVNHNVTPILEDAKLSTEGYCQLNLDPHDAQLVLLSETDLLERQARRQLAEWSKHMQFRQEKEQQAEDERQAAAQFREEEREKLRSQKQQELLQEHETLAIHTKEREEEMKRESKADQQHLEQSLREYQAELARMAQRVAAEQMQWLQDKEQQQEQQQQRQQASAVKIQSVWRGHSVRTKHSKILKQNIEQKKKEFVEKRIHAIEQQRKAEERRLKEEQKNVEEEKKKEEARLKAEQERLKKEEEVRLQEAKLKAEQERLQKEQEEQLQEERHKQEEERKYKAEQEKKIKEEEERKKKEVAEQRMKEKERKRDEARREAEERKKREEEEIRKKEEEERLKDEEEQKRKEEERKKMEEEEKHKEAEKKRKEEDKKKQEESNKKAAEEKKQKEDKLKIEKERKKKKTELAKHQSATGRVQRAPVCLPESLEQMRLEWIKQCKPWSKIVSDQRTATTQVIKKPLRRPTSGQRLPPFTDTAILFAAKVSALQQVTTVELQDLPGFSMTTFSSCPHLQDLTMHRCHLVAIEGLENHSNLIYADFSGNSVELVNVRGCQKLIYLDVSHNRLSSLHGLEGCAALAFLNASHNKITRIGGLEGLSKMHTLYLNGNQLITVRGLGVASSLQYLDLSGNHLPVIEDLEPLGLLQGLHASSNNLMKPPKLTNHVLLRELVLDDNSLTSLDSLPQTWLPLLQMLNISQNGLIHLEEFSGCVSMETVDISNNQILDSASLVPALASLPNLQLLSTQGNPAAEEANYTALIQEAVPSVHTLDGAAVQTCWAPQLTQFELMCSAQIDAQLKLYEAFEEAKYELSGSGSQLGMVYAAYSSQSHDMAVEHRYMHEYGEISSRLQTSSVLYLSMTPCESQPELTNTSLMKNKFDAALQRANAQPSQPTMNDTSALQQANTQPGPPTMNDTSVMKDKFESSLHVAAAPPCRPSVVDTLHMIDAEVVHYPKPPSMSKPVVHPGHMDGEVATRLSEAGHGSGIPPIHTGFSLAADLVGHRMKENWSSTAHSAAIKIQALWRGYILRRRIQLALDWVHLSEGDDMDEDREFKEIDLEEFGFNMTDLDVGWLPPDTPQLPPSHPVLGPPASVLQPQGAVSGMATMVPPASVPQLHGAVSGMTTTVPPLHLFGAIPHPPSNPRQAWRNAESPISQNSQQGKPPLPPLSRMSDRSNVTTDTRRTAASKKSEKIQEDWGFKDSRTTEMMMQRAKKLKYNAQKKRKLSQLDPHQRLALFRCLEQSSHKQVFLPRKILPRKEYFQAKEEEERERQAVNAQDGRHRAQRTYEWIHTQVGDFEVTDSRINKGFHRVSSEDNLPQMTPTVLSGGRPSLTGSPTLELQSVGSVSNCGEQRRYSQSEQSNSSKVLFPPIKTGSAPSSQVKERMSFRNKPADRGSGWGSGKKRARHK